MASQIDHRSSDTARPKLTPSFVLALVALVVALGGTATAARTLIGSKDIATGAIKARNIAPGAVTLGKIAPAARAALQGTSGPQGPSGPSGLAGGFDLNKISRVVGAEVTILPGQLGSALATCLPGQKVVGGGFVTVGFDQTVFASAPSIDGTTWVVLLDNANAQVTNLIGSAYALCVAPSQPSSNRTAAAGRGSVHQVRQDAVREN